MRLLMVIKRDVSAALAEGRNLNEGVCTTCIRMALIAKCLYKATLCGFRSCRVENLGSRVVVDGVRQAFVSNWANSKYPTLCGDDYYEEYVNRDRIKNIVDLQEMIHRFVCGFSFYSGSWMRIDINTAIYGNRSHGQAKQKGGG